MDTTVIKKKQRAVKKLIPYASKNEADYAKQSLLEKNELILKTGLAVRADPEKIWDKTNSRAMGRVSHGWIFLRGFYTSFEDFSSAGLQTFSTWLDSALNHWLSLDPDEQPMKLHDETVAQRVMAFSALVFESHGRLGEQLELRLKAQLNADLELLASPEFYAGDNNHGMFQNFGLLVADALETSSNPSRSQIQRLAFRRLLDYLSKCFTSDGIHVENSPSYHLMVSRQLRAVLLVAESFGWGSEFSQLEHIAKKADRFAAFALSPGGTFVPVSDTSSVKVTEHAARDAYGDGLLAARVRNIKKLSGQSLDAHRSGYTVVCGEHPETGVTQLFFSAAYNADYHKHSDEMSIYWYHSGYEVLREAGPNGYDYDDPLTKYAYSSRAHNSLLVDGRGLPRIDRMASRTKMSKPQTVEGALTVEATTKRFQSVEWSRTLRIPNRMTLERFSVSDVAVSESGVDRDFTFVWHFDPRLELRLDGSCVQLVEPSGLPVAQLRWNTHHSCRVEAMRGETEPVVQGWAFPSMGVKVPSWAVEVTIRGSKVEVDWQLEMLTSQRQGVSQVSPFQENFRSRDHLSDLDYWEKIIKSGELAHLERPAPAGLSRQIALGEWGFWDFRETSFESGKTHLLLVMPPQEPISVSSIERGINILKEAETSATVIVPESLDVPEHIQDIELVKVPVGQVSVAFSRLVRSVAQHIAGYDSAPFAHTVFLCKSADGNDTLRVFVMAPRSVNIQGMLFKDGKSTGISMKLVRGRAEFPLETGGAYRVRFYWDDSDSKGAFGSWTSKV